MKKQKKIIENLGFISKPGTFKKRTTFELNQALIEIDEYKEIPVFLEIEAKNEEKIKEIIKMFDFDESQVKSWGADKLFKHYKKGTN